PSDAVGSPHYLISELNTHPTVTPVQRFKCTLTTALTWLGARVVRYSFPVRLFPSLLHAGLSRRYPDDRFSSSALRRSRPVLHVSNRPHHYRRRLVPTSGRGSATKHDDSAFHFRQGARVNLLGS